MDSASKEYFHTLEAIREELHAFKSEQNKIRFQISNIFEENKKLTNELRENVEMRFLELSDSDMGQLQQKLEAAVAAKIAAIEMWQAALQHLEVQEDLLLGKKSILRTERNEVEKQFQQMKDEYTKGLNVLSDELTNTRTELTQVKKMHEERTSALEKCKMNLESTSKQLETYKTKISELSDINYKLDQELTSTRSSLSGTNKALDDNTREIVDLRAKNSDLVVYVSQLEEQIKELKSKMLDFEKDAKESLLTAQEAILQKKEIIYKEEKYQKDIEVLKSSIDLETQKVSMRYKAEIKDIQKKAKEKVEGLVSEIKQLHKEIGEKQSLFERADREKQALESKLELLLSETSNAVPVSGVSFDNMCKQLTVAERTRDEYALKILSLETTLREIKLCKEQEIQDLTEKQKNLKERMQNLSKDFNQASSDRIKLSDEATKLRKKCFELDKELKNVKAKYAREISTLEEESQKKLRTSHEQLLLADEHYKNVCNELQKLLDNEFRISSKWKAEVEDVISKSELKIRELCQEIVQLKNSNSRLINILDQNNVRIPNEYIANL